MFQQFKNKNDYQQMATTILCQIFLTHQNVNDLKILRTKYYSSVDLNNPDQEI